MTHHFACLFFFFGLKQQTISLKGRMFYIRVLKDEESLKQTGSCVQNSFQITQIIFKFHCPLSLIGTLLSLANYHRAKSPGEIFLLKFSLSVWNSINEPSIKG